MFESDTNLWDLFAEPLNVRIITAIELYIHKYENVCLR